jgi:hypothetical protein
VENFLDLYFSKFDLAEADMKIIRLIADVSLFDHSVYAYIPSEFSSAIIYSITNRSKLSEKMDMSLKWMI